MQNNKKTVSLIPIPWYDNKNYNTKKSMRVVENIINSFAQAKIHQENIFFENADSIPVKIYKISKELEKSIELLNSEQMIIINDLISEMNMYVYNDTMSCLRDQSIPIVIGGSPSVRLSAIEAASKKYSPIDIIHFSGQLHLDGKHISKGIMADLATKVSNIRNIINIGTKSYSAEEKASFEKINNSKGLLNNNHSDLFGIGKENTEIYIFHDFEISEAKLLGTIDNKIKEIYKNIKQDVWVSIDLSVFNPTEQSSKEDTLPGGFQYYEFLYFFKELAKMPNVNITGVDLVNCSNSNKDINLCAQILFNIVPFILYESNKK